MALPEYTAYSTEGKRKLPPNLNPLRPIAALTGIALKPAEPGWSTEAPAPEFLGAQPPVLAGSKPAPFEYPGSPPPYTGADTATAVPGTPAVGDFTDRGFGQPREVSLGKYAIGSTTEGAAIYDPVAQLARLRAIDPEKYGGGSTGYFDNPAMNVGSGGIDVPDLGSMTPGEAVQAKNRYNAAVQAQRVGLERQRLGLESQRVAGEAEGRRMQYGVGMAGVGERRYATDVSAETAARGQELSAEGQQLQYAGTIAGHLQRQKEAEARAAQEAAKSAWEQTKFGQTLQAGPEELVLNPSTGMMEPRKQYFTPSEQGLVKFGGGPKPAPSQADIEHTAKLRGMTVEEVKAKLGLK